MTMKKYFVAILALVAAVACSKDDSSDPILDSSKKSVSISIANMAQGSRVAAEGGVTASGNEVACADMEDVYFLFADASNNILAVYAAVDTPAADVSGTSYTYHGIPEVVQQVAAVANVAVAPKANESLLKYEQLYEVEDVDGEFNTQVVYGVSNLTRKVDSSGQLECVVDGDHEYPLYGASIELVPYTARIEITHIGCTDFGTYAAIGIENLHLANRAYGFHFQDFVQDADLYTYPDYVLTKDKVHTTTGGVHDANCIAPADGKVWSLNITEQNVSDLIMSAYTKGDGYTTLVAEKTVTINTYKVNGTAITKFEKGNIYRFPIDFTHKNFDGDNESICATVEVDIHQWVVNPVEIDFAHK